MRVINEKSLRNSEFKPIKIIRLTREISCTYGASEEIKLEVEILASMRW
jgi:hypothetical protein